MNEQPQFLYAERSWHGDVEESESTAADSDRVSHAEPSDPSHGCVDWYEYGDDDEDD